MIWLGVDGGGSKTAFALIDDTGRLLAAATGPGSYHLADGLDHVAEVLRAGTVAVCNDAGIVAADIDHAYVGLPGHGETTADLAAIEALPAVALGHARYGCGNDMVCAWAGSLAGADGVNVVAGTGSIAYGERDGRGARAGGWGEVFGDEGSAYWIAVQGLRLAARMSDGRSPRGPLLDVLLEHLGLTAELDLVDVVLTRWRGDRPRIAALARQVGVAVERGDPAAAGVFVAAGRELADLVTATRRGLNWPDATPMPVSWSGGVFDAVVVRETFRDALERSPLPYDVRRPVLTPVLGAAVHAARLAGHPLAPEALVRLRGPAARTTAADTGSVASGAG